VSVGYAAPTDRQGPGGAFVVITNNTGNLLPAVQETAGQDATSANLAPGPNTILMPIANDGSSRLHLQPFPLPGLFGDSAGAALTLIVVVERSPGQRAVAFVGQMIAGAIG
jgi:hypothetical protein